MQLVLSNIIAVFATWFPNIYRDYVALMVRLADHYPDFEPPIRGSVFAAHSGNARRAMTYLHLDEMNKAGGICPIICIGDFDPKKGGHLVLPQLGIVIEFPPGSIILIPSATLVHGNVAIEKHEQRESMTLYTAGGLFRWVKYGFQSEKDFKVKDPEGWAAELKDRAGRWQREISKFSTVDSVAADRLRPLVV